MTVLCNVPDNIRGNTCNVLDSILEEYSGEGSVLPWQRVICGQQTVATTLPG